jgi:hypothetical protein
MNFERISTSKCRGKLQIMGVLYTHSLKSPGPFPKLPKILFFIIKTIKKIWNSPIGAGVDPRSPASHGSTPAPVRLFPFFLNFFFFLPSTFCTSGQLLLVGSSTCPPCPGPKDAFFFSRKAKNSMCSSDTDQNRFVRRTNIQSFRG